MYKNSRLIKIFSTLFFLIGGKIYAQQELNAITTAVPFLLIAPDSRAGGMGDAGVAASPDGNSIHWNPSKLAFIKEDMGFSLSYIPWLRSLVPDINLSYLSGYKRLDNNQTIAASLFYSSLGDITFTDQSGMTIGNYRPNEFAFDLAYARKLSPNFSGGMALRYIYSNLTMGQVVGGADTRPGMSVAADISGYYVNPDAQLGNIPATVAFGLNISNIGSKMSYSGTGRRDFIPINMRLGPSITLKPDDYNSITFV
ncbi:MAG TPA: type IX secretion system outer membrane channel protein PorV, partial [Bacteroidia bacterium]|nr:type IX secretion system outer membrane channel protein PorV [Bacteroidia bacterium]